MLVEKVKKSELGYLKLDKQFAFWKVPTFYLVFGSKFPYSLPSSGNIKIKFYELDSDFREVWSAYGDFSEADVHHQYAIIFRCVKQSEITISKQNINC